jgi:hypothetical protein
MNRAHVLRCELLGSHAFNLHSVARKEQCSALSLDEDFMQLQKAHGDECIKWRRQHARHSLKRIALLHAVAA